MPRTRGDASAETRIADAFSYDNQNRTSQLRPRSSVRLGDAKFALSFDLLAPHYRWLESLLAGGKLQRCRLAFLDRIPDARRILLLGEGHGRGLVECRRRFPSARITCLDASGAMLRVARERLLRVGYDDRTVEFIHVDVLEWTPPVETFDLLVANYFFDCFRPEQLERIIPRLATGAAAHANWLIADFHVPASGLRRLRSRVILAGMYFFFRTVTRLPARNLTAPDRYLETAGFSRRASVESEWGLLRSDWWGRG
jgi:SAM-dependent methyltransferase